VTALLAAVIFAAVTWRRTSAIARVPKYETLPAQRGDLIVTISATGTLQPTNQVEVGSELSGIIESVEVDDNDTVEVGQVLARLDTEKLTAQVVKFRAALEAARARVLEAKANVVETRSTLQRMKEVWEKTEKRAPSEHDIEIAEAAFQRAQAAEASAVAQVAEAEANLNASETDLTKAAIQSPINGVVLTREVEPGQTVAASLQAPILFMLAEDLAQMELHVDVDEADVGQVKEGQGAVFSVDAYPDMDFHATVSQVRYGSQTVNGVVTYKTTLKVNNSDLLLRPGMTATADITVKNVQNALLAPNAALRFSPPSEEKEAPPATLTGRLLPRPRWGRSRPGDKESQGPKGEKLVWTLKDGNPAAISITVGSTDGSMTEIVSGEIEEGTPLLVGLEEARK